MIVNTLPSFPADPIVDFVSDAQNPLTLIGLAEKALEKSAVDGMLCHPVKVSDRTCISGMPKAKKRSMIPTSARFLDV